MNRYIPYDKLSKKQKRAADLKNRGSWGSISPVTRRPDNPKAYKRSKMRKWSPDDSSAFYFAHRSPRARLCSAADFTRVLYYYIYCDELLHFSTHFVKSVK